MPLPDESMEQAVVDAALNLAGQSMAHAFTLPIPNTTPRLLVSLYEDGTTPPGSPRISALAAPAHPPAEQPSGQVQPPVAWMPIETAPKDRLIDIWIPHAEGGGVRWAGCHYDRICDEWRVAIPGERIRSVRAKAVSHWIDPPAAPGAAAPIPPALSDEQIDALARAHLIHKHTDLPFYRRFARAVLAAQPSLQEAAPTAPDELIAMLERCATRLENCRYSELPLAQECRALLARIAKAPATQEAAAPTDLQPEPFWHAVVSAKSPVINKAIKRADAADEYAQKCRLDGIVDADVIPLFRELAGGAPAGAPAVSDDQTAKDAARYRYIVAVYGFTLAEDLFGITTGRNVSIELDAAIDENIEAHKQWRPK